MYSTEHTRKLITKQFSGVSKMKDNMETKIKKIVRENQELFTLLEDLDKTGKLRKLKYKKRAIFTIDEDIFREFRNYCFRQKQDMSPIVEELIIDYLKKMK